MKVGIVVFPGSNCDVDCFIAIKKFPGAEVSMIWHKETSLNKSDIIVIPGGFSYGDYLRCGAIAKFSPIMREVIPFAKKGGYLLGICNGFQILIESALLPGVLVRNKNLKFMCDTVTLKLNNTKTPYTRKIDPNQLLKIPIAHGEGNYFIDPAGLKRLKDQNQIVFQYSNAKGEITDDANPNGSLENIAGICSENGRVLGMMPHPERVCDPILGGTDGRAVFEFVNTL